MSTLFRFSTFIGAILFALSAPVAAFHGGGHGGGGGGGFRGGGGGFRGGGGVRAGGFQGHAAPAAGFNRAASFSAREPCLTR